MHSPRTVIAAVLLLAVGSLLAGPEDNIRAALAKADANLKIGSIEPSPIPGVYEVAIGDSVTYMAGDGRYWFRGDIVDLKTHENLTEMRSAALATKFNPTRKGLVDGIGESAMVIFDPAGETKHTITVFTDIDCGYCRKLHSQIADYGKEGIRVRYVFFPRAGKDSSAYKEAVSVWCAGDAAARRAALTAAKAGKPVAEATCDNPIDKHMAVVEELNLTGTPAIVTDSGELIAGYVEPRRLAAKLAAAPPSGTVR